MFHAGFSFIPGMIPGLWAIVDNSPSTTLSVVLFASHMFRMTLFFFVAGFFARMMFHRKGARGFWPDRAKRILLPLVVGWMMLLPAMTAVWIWGLTQDVRRHAAASAGEHARAPPRRVPADASLVSLLPADPVRAWCSPCARRRGARRSRGALRARWPTRWCAALVRTGAAAVLLPLPLDRGAVRASPSGSCGSAFPRRISRSIPQLASLVGYGTAVAFGWLIHRQVAICLRSGAGSGRSTWPLRSSRQSSVSRSPASMPAFVPAVPGAPTLALRARLRHRDLVLVLRADRRRRALPVSRDAAVRYVADASYWIYLAHLPVVVALQVMVGQLPLHWSVKFPLVLGVEPRGAVCQLPLSRARDVHRAGPQRPPVPARPSRAMAPSDSPAVPAMPRTAQLIADGVAPRRAQAIRDDGRARGLDLDVRPGEVLAVLGPNGAGKSTAIALLARSARAGSGHGTPVRRTRRSMSTRDASGRDDAGRCPDTGAARARAIA